MRVLVTGAGGLLGSALVEAASGRGDDVVRTARRGEAGAVALDLANVDAIPALVAAAHPDLVVHTAARTDVDACEDDEAGATRLHADAPAALARAARARGARFVHVSTDAVVEGGGAPASEAAPVVAVNAYARSKALGERRVAEANSDALVVRTNFFGARRGASPGRSLAEWALGELEAGRAVTGFVDVRFNPLWSGHLATLLLDAAATPARGLLHLAGGEALTKHDFLVRLARAFGLDPALVRAGRASDRAWKARRLASSVLDVRRAESLLGRAMPGVDEGLRAFAASRGGVLSRRPGASAHGDR